MPLYPLLTVGRYGGRFASGPIFMMIERKEQANVQWFAVQTYSGYENKVKNNLEQRIASMNAEDKIFRVLVPMEDVVVVKDGKSKQMSRKLFPSYVLVEMIMDDQSWYVVRHTPGVTGFVGAGAHPLPLSDEEVRDVLVKVGELEAETPQIVVECQVGDSVRVKSGPFVGAVGVVSDVNTSTGKVKFVLSVFGRETEAEVNHTELERV